MGCRSTNEDTLGEPAYLHFGPVTRKALVTVTTGHQSVLSKNP